MRRILRASLVTCALVTGAVASTSLPVFAQMDQMGDTDAAISFDSFQDQLAPYGYWLYSDRWGVVWQPSQVPYDFRPYYTDGRWVYTDDYGWFWQSDYQWGDIPFHFGRWVNDPDDGWLWMPGFIWSPGWVAWRTNGSYIGWTPLPPDDVFLGGRGDIGAGVSLRFGGFDISALYSRWYGPAWNERRFAENWVFVPAAYVAAPDFRRMVIRDPARVVNIIHETRNVTNYTVVNNIVVNRSIDVSLVERAAGHPITPVRAASVIRRPNLVTRVDVGQRVQIRMRDVVPRGRGIANSAPPPPPRVVAKLSPNATPRNGSGPSHLFTRTTAAAPEVQGRFRGAPVRGPAAGPGGEMTGPGAPGMRPGQVGGAMQGQAPGGPPGAGERRRPNNPAGPGGTMQSEQPGGPAAPSERGRPERPNNAAGPGGTQPEQPGGPSGPGGGAMQGQPPAGPPVQGERGRPERPNNAAGPDNTQPEQPGGPAGPRGGAMQSQQPTGPTAERRRAAPNGPSGPDGGTMKGEQPGGPAAPSGGRARPEQPNSAGGPNAERPRPQQPNSMSQQNNSPNREQQRKKQEKPPQNPPQNPPQ